MKQIFLISSLIFGLSLTASAEDLDSIGADKIRPPAWVCLSYNYNNGKFYTGKGFRRNQARQRSLRKCRRIFFGGNVDDFFVPIGRRRICSPPKCFRWGRFQRVPFN
ncbi:MAG: hypothetical protein DRQ88_00435 [Epsilonproteobacteria bacterium]|nr:MAG: hypothetical protein DRQ89_03515 [Campylobacterota bacterium]RLA68103.1 MAG: hypothetical protein DRQ88_00435 [Campylobacterota bacterium]